MLLVCQLIIMIQVRKFVDQAFLSTITQWNKYDFTNFIGEAQGLNQWFEVTATGEKADV